MKDLNQERLYRILDRNKKIIDNSILKKDYRTASNRIHDIKAFTFLLYSGGVIDYEEMKELDKYAGCGTKRLNNVERKLINEFYG